LHCSSGRRYRPAANSWRPAPRGPLGKPLGNLDPASVHEAELHRDSFDRPEAMAKTKLPFPSEPTAEAGTVSTSTRLRGARSVIGASSALRTVHLLSSKENGKSLASLGEKAR